MNADQRAGKTAGSLPRGGGQPSPRYRASFYPMRLGLLCVGQNFMPIAWWTPVSKHPFRFLLAVDRKNYSLKLLRENGEAALCFLPWEERTWVVQAGYLTGRRCSKAERLGVRLRPAHALEFTFVPEHATAVYEMRVEELLSDGDHALFFGNVLHAEGCPGGKMSPILFMGFRDFATLGRTWRWPG